MGPECKGYVPWVRGGGREKNGIHSRPLIESKANPFSSHQARRYPEAASPNFFFFFRCNPYGKNDMSTLEKKRSSDG
ncbi:hypothetical protein CEXT_465891 [Caerostris extrusa]|uniref:Ycf15 n=1 Tax=Caerostris extrusa TaxID=172846 RepID=A0AAV4PSP1_CAEEX|nr:hypothetical protein CEXT_465891 [Caerostris extrusa]